MESLDATQTVCFKQVFLFETCLKGMLFLDLMFASSDQKHLDNHFIQPFA